MNPFRQPAEPRAGLALIGGSTALVLALLSAACVASRAPGSDEVKLTDNAADVAPCTAVGKVRVPGGEGVVGIDNAPIQFRNSVIGLGGNTGLVTEGLLSIPSAGIAYRCPVKN